VTASGSGATSTTPRFVVEETFTLSLSSSPRIADAVALDEQVRRFREIYNSIRPHEALKFLTPMTARLAEPKLFGAVSVQKS
jgi:transposase InsO family protein